MQSYQAPSEHLAHFDRPKTVNLPDFEWDERAVLTEPAGQPCEWFEPQQFCDVSRIVENPIKRRGISWVLSRVAAIAVMVGGAVVLTEIFFVTAAEHSLIIAARAGAMEATLPRANYQTVSAAIERRLPSQSTLNERLSVAFAQNGELVQQPYFRQSSGDRFAVTLSAPKYAALPHWLRPLSIWDGNARINAHAVQKIPGRKLPQPKPNQTAAE